MEINKAGLSSPGQLVNGEKTQKNEAKAGEKTAKLDFGSLLSVEIETGLRHEGVKECSNPENAGSLTGGSIRADEVLGKLSINGEPTLEEVGMVMKDTGDITRGAGRDLPRVNPETMTLLEKHFGPMQIREGIQEIRETDKIQEAGSEEEIRGQLLMGFLRLRKDLSSLPDGGTGIAGESGSGEISDEKTGKTDAAAPAEAGALLDFSGLLPEMKAVPASQAPEGNGNQKNGATISMVAPTLSPPGENRVRVDGESARLAYAEPGGAAMDMKAAARIAYSEVTRIMTGTKDIGNDPESVSVLPREAGEPAKGPAASAGSFPFSQVFEKEEPRGDVPIAPRGLEVPVAGQRAAARTFLPGEVQRTPAEKDDRSSMTIQPPSLSPSPVLLQVDRDEGAAAVLGEGLSRFVEVARNRKGHRGTVILDPPDLGTVRVTVQSSREKVQVHLVVESLQAKNLIDSSIGALRNSMARQGLTLGETTVDVGGQGLEGGGSSDWRFRETGDSRTLAGIGSPVDEVEEEQVVARLDIERGLLHWIA